MHRFPDLAKSRERKLKPAPRKRGLSFSDLALRHGKRFRRSGERVVCKRRDFIKPGFKRNPHVFNRSLARGYPGFLPRLRFPAQHHKLAQIRGVHRASRRRVYNVRSMLIGMRDITRGVMLPRWPWKIMHTRGESILPISGPKVSGGNWWPRFGRSTAFSPLFGENSLNHEDQEKYQVLRLMANALSISFSWWVAITLAILLTWVFEASFRRCGQWSLASHYP